MKTTTFKLSQKSKGTDYNISGFEISVLNIVFRIGKIDKKCSSQKFYNKHIYFYKTKYCKSVEITFLKKYMFGWKKTASSREIAKDMMGMF